MIWYFKYFSETRYRTFLDTLYRGQRVKAYQGNCFNIPFYNGCAVSPGHFMKLFGTHETLPSHKQNNQLTHSVKYDLQDPIIVGGVRAMGIINCHITQPITRMLDDNAILVTQTSSYYSHLHESVSAWMVDPQPLMDNSALLFENFVPPRDNLHQALYNTVSEEIEFSKQQAMSIVLHNIYVLLFGNFKIICLVANSMTLMKSRLLLRQLRASHPDAHFCAALFKYLCQHVIQHAFQEQCGIFPRW